MIFHQAPTTTRWWGSYVETMVPSMKPRAKTHSYWNIFTPIYFREQAILSKVSRQYPFFSFSSIIYQVPKRTASPFTNNLINRDPNETSDLRIRIWCIVLTTRRRTFFRRYCTRTSFERYATIRDPMRSSNGGLLWIWNFDSISAWSLSS